MSPRHAELLSGDAPLGRTRLSARHWSRASPVVLLAVVTTLTGCQRDPLEQTISVRNEAAFLAWRGRVTTGENLDVRRRVEESLQEMRFKVSADREIKRMMAEKAEKYAETIDEVIRQKVNGRRLGDVVRAGYELRLARLSEELAGLENAMDKNARLVTRPGDLASQHHLDGLRERQNVRIEKYRADITAAEKELARLPKGSGQSLFEGTTSRRDEMTERKAPGAKTRA